MNNNDERYYMTAILDKNGTDEKRQAALKIIRRDLRENFEKFLGDERFVKHLRDGKILTIDCRFEDKTDG